VGERERGVRRWALGKGREVGEALGVGRWALGKGKEALGGGEGERRWALGIGL